jgi:UDP-N-acetylmuramate--alanine ligase
VRRRFDECYFSQNTGIRVIDDYGHHPTEVKAVLATARQTGHSRILTVFQPHRYSRTKLCWDDFLTCFRETDLLLVLPVYAAGEEPIEGVDSEALVGSIREGMGPGFRVETTESLEAAASWVVKNVERGDLILTLGAGSITRLSGMLASRLN